MPPSRQGSRQGERSPPSRGRELPPPSRNGEKPPSRIGEKPPSRQGESRQGERPSMLQQGLPMQHITADSDGDLTVSANSLEILWQDMFSSPLSPFRLWGIKVGMKWLKPCVHLKEELVVSALAVTCSPNSCTFLVVLMFWHCGCCKMPHNFPPSLFQTSLPLCHLHAQHNRICDLWWWVIPPLDWVFSIPVRYSCLKLTGSCKWSHNFMMSP